MADEIIIRPEEKLGGYEFVVRRRDDGSIYEVIGDADRIHLEQVGEAEWNLMVSHGGMWTAFTIIGKFDKGKVVICRGRSQKGEIV